MGARCRLHALLRPPRRAATDARAREPRVPAVYGNSSTASKRSTSHRSPADLAPVTFRRGGGGGDGGGGGGGGGGATCIRPAGMP